MSVAETRFCGYCGSGNFRKDGDAPEYCVDCGTLWMGLIADTRAPDPAVAALEAEVARLRADVTYERGLNGRDAERIFTLSLLDDEIEVLTNAASSFDVQDGIALAAFRKRLVKLWRARDRLPAPSEKEAHCDDLIPADRITELEAEVARLRAGLAMISANEYPAAGMVNGKCRHDRYSYEPCEECVWDFADSILHPAPSENEAG